MIKKLKVTNELGVCARPAGMITKTASRFACDIKLVKGDITVNAKSPMGVMFLAAECGCVLKVIADGKDEAEAVQALTKIFEDKFGLD